MNPKASRQVFVNLATENAVDLSVCTPRSGFKEMLKFYENVGPIGCGGDEADMLLYQWGTYDWGSGEHFELNLTRQFIEQTKQDDDAISQLGFTSKFESSAGLKALGSGNRWCHGVAELEAFRDFVDASAAFAEVADIRAELNEVSFSYV